MYHFDCKIFQTIHRHIDMYDLAYIYHVYMASDMLTVVVDQFHNDHRPNQADIGMYYCPYTYRHSCMELRILLGKKYFKNNMNKALTQSNKMLKLQYSQRRPK